MSGKGVKIRTLEQQQGSDPDYSVWISANAGSGKTSVLVDRILRLLLNGVKFEKILCLTYTDATENEMRKRLMDILAKWHSMKDQDLKEDLERISAPLGLELARNLFSVALENFHKVRIQTVHSFCLSLIKKFPIECGVFPGFRILDEAGIQYKEECMREVLEKFDYNALSLIFSGLSDLDGFLEGMDSNRYLIRKYIADPTTGQVNWEDLVRKHWHSLGDYISEQDSITGKDVKKLQEAEIQAQNYMAGSLKGDLGDYWDEYCHCLFTTEGKPRKFLNKHSNLKKQLQEVVKTIDQVNDCKREQSRKAFLSFAGEFLNLYQKKKKSMKLLDYSDLIEKGSQLLQGFGDQWVGYRLDGTIDHVLLDEAQDISLDQWTIIEVLVKEFFAQENDRTLMVVGDPKQSIYRFQGGGHFEKKKADFIEDDKMMNLCLSHSFRLPTVIVDLVNSLTGLENRFVQPLESDLPHYGSGSLGYIECKGRVELWDAISQGKQEEKREEVAKSVVQKISSMLGESYSKIGGNLDSTVKIEDFLILFPRRNDLFREIEKELRASRLNFVSSSKKKYSDEPLVKSVLLVMQVALNPNDDLHLCGFLRGVVNLAPDFVEGLCLKRQEDSVWKILQQENPDVAGKVREMYQDVRKLTPYQFFHRWIWQFEALQLNFKLLDDFFNVCKKYQNAPGLSSGEFITWLQKLPKKKADLGEGNSIKLMTVHNAKGLESPIVFLPDCCEDFSLTKDKKSRILYGQNYPILPGLDREKDPEWKKEEEITMKERCRLLYVAITRAKYALYCTGATPYHKQGNNDWHGLIHDAVTNAGARRDGKNLILS